MPQNDKEQMTGGSVVLTYVGQTVRIIGEILMFTITGYVRVRYKS